MKRLLFTILVILSTGFSLQSQDTVFTQAQVIRIGNYIDSLEKTNQLLIQDRNTYNKIITQLSYKVDYLDQMRLQDSMLMNYKDREVALLNESILRHKELVKVEKRKWYDKPVVWFLTGVGMVYLSSEIIANVK